ncbi:hypothetical protein JQ543_27330 [Bradyrhizobium diazoefficiens]|nr:hypothetical protein [Bradyrhizobium diazoefficiens]MBR0851485.1 hypothetical protein [Bradyrhizobium diazoefficiens]
MNTPQVTGFDAKDQQGRAVRLTVSTDIVDYFEATRVFGREDLADPSAHGRYQPRLIAVPDRRPTVTSPMVFSIGNQNDLFLVRHDSARDGGWNVVDLDKAIAAKVGTVRVRALGAAWTDDDRISVAVAVDDGSNTRSRVFVAFDLASATTAFDAIPWIDCGSRDDVRIEGIRVLDNGDKSWTVVLAGQNGPNEAVYLLQSGGSHQFADALVFNPAVTLQEILDFQAGVHPTFGPGLHVLGTSGGQGVLAFRPFPDYDASGRPVTIPPVVPLPCPAGASVLDTGPTGPDGADLYIGGQGVSLITAAELDNAQQAKVVAVTPASVAPDVQKLIAAVAPDGSAAVWTLTLDGTLAVARRPAGGGFGAPLQLRGNVQEIAAVPGDHHLVTSLLVVYGDSHATLLWQDAAHRSWQESPLAVADPGTASQVTCYGTVLRVLDGSSIARAGVKVAVSASALASVVVNGSAEFIGPDVRIEAVTDSRGVVGIFDRVRSLTPAIYRFDVDGIGAFDVNPAGGVHQRFQAMTGDELRAATVTVDGGSQPLLPDEYRQDGKRGQVDLIAASFNKGAVLAAGTNGIGAGIRAAQRGAAFSSALHPATLPAGYKWGIRADANGVSVASGGDIDKLISAADKVGAFFVGLGESIADFFEGIGHKIAQGWTFVVHKAEDAVRFICALGDQVKHFVLNTLEEVGSFFTWLWQQVKTGLEKLWDYLKFLFDWQDMLRVRDVVLDTADETLQYLQRSIADAKRPVSDAFDRAIGTIEGWRKAAGVPPTRIPPAAPGTSLVDRLEQVAKPVQDVIDKAMGNSVVTWVMTRLDKVLGEIVAFEQPNPYDEAMEAAEGFATGLIKDELNDLERGFDSIRADLANLFGNSVPDLRTISADTLRKAVIAVGSDALETLLRGVRDLALRLLDLLQKLVGTLRDALKFKVRLPFIEDFVKLVTGGKVNIDTSFSFAEAFVMLAAVPATIVYKLANGHAPFAKGEVVTLPFGQVTVQSGADAAKRDLAIVDLTAQGVKMIANTVQAGLALKGGSPSDTTFGLTLALCAAVPQLLSVAGETVAAASKENPTDAVRGLDITCLLLSLIVVTKTSGQVRAIGRGLMTADDARGFNSVFDPVVFGIHMVLKMTDDGVGGDNLGLVEEMFDKLCLIGIGVSPRIKDPKIKGLVLLGSLASRYTAVGCSAIKLATLK